MSKKRSIESFQLSLLQFITVIVSRCDIKQKYKERILQEFNSEPAQKTLYQLIQKEVPRRKEKRRKDPFMPTLPRTPYIMFVKSKKDEVKKELLKSKDVVSGKDMFEELGKQWKALTNKNLYIRMAEDDKQRYNQELITYVPPKIKKRKTELPKPLKTSYQYFCCEMKAENKNITFEELGKLWKEEYNTAKKRKKWHKLYKQDRKRYYEEKKVMQQKHIDNKRKEIETKLFTLTKKQG